MNIKLVIFYVICALLMFSTSSITYAEAAPVYDVEALDQPLDGNMETATASDETSASAPASTSAQDEVFVPIDPVAPVRSQPADEPNEPIKHLTMEKRLQNLEEQLNRIRQSGDNKPPQVDNLNNEVESLRAQVDQLNNQLARLQRQRRKPVEEKQSDSADVEASAGEEQPINPQAAAVEAEAEQKKSTQPDAIEEQKIYQSAYNLIKEKKYSEAIDILQSMLEKYPSGQFAANAHYWLGELYGLMGKNDHALREFNKVVDNYPASSRVSDALLKTGLIFAAQSQWSDAKSAFRKVINKYPGTASSRLATEQLRQIKQAGH